MAPQATWMPGSCPTWLATGLSGLHPLRWDPKRLASIVTTDEISSITGAASSHDGRANDSHHLSDSNLRGDAVAKALNGLICAAGSFSGSGRGRAPARWERDHVGRGVPVTVDGFVVDGR